MKLIKTIGLGMIILVLLLAFPGCDSKPKDLETVKADLSLFLERNPAGIMMGQDVRLFIWKPGGVIYFRTMLETSVKRNMFYVLPRKILRLFLSRLDSKSLWNICYLFGIINKIPFANVISRKLFLYYDPQNNDINVTRLMNFRRYGKHSYRHRLKKEDIMKTITSQNKAVNIKVFNNVFMVSA